MRRHHRQNTSVDRSAIKPAKLCFPLIHIEWIDGRDQMLVPVIIALSGPMFYRCGNAMGLECFQLSHRMFLDHLDICAKTACGDNCAAKRRIDVENRREGPIDTDGRSFLCHYP